MYQPYPSSGEPTRPLRPAAPAPVRTAVKLMYAGAAGLIIGLALIIVDIQAAARGRFLGHSLTAPQMRPLVITVCRRLPERADSTSNRYPSRGPMGRRRSSSLSTPMGPLQGCRRARRLAVSVSRSSRPPAGAG